MKPVRQQEWVVYAKKPFAGLRAVMAYLSRYTHRVAIASSRLLTQDENGVTFKWKDYRERSQGGYRQKTMTLTVDEFIRSFLIHVLPRGFHCIRHYGLLTNAVRVDNLARVRTLLTGQSDQDKVDIAKPRTEEPVSPFICPSCKAPMIIIETFERGHLP